MGEASAFQIAMVLVAACLAVINLLIGIILNHMLQEQRAVRVILREIETQYFPRAEFQRYETAQTAERHRIKEDIVALEIRAGAWRST